jgi:hypothetical protein
MVQLVNWCILAEVLDHELHLPVHVPLVLPLESAQSCSPQMKRHPTSQY